MDEKKNIFASIIVAVAIIALGAALVFSGRPSVTVHSDSSPVSVSVTSDGKPVVVTGSDGLQDQSFGAYAPVPSEETVWTSGKFTDDLTVTDSASIGGTLGVTGNVNLSGSLTVSGTSTFSGEVSGVAKSVVTTMSSSATTTACAVLNSSGSSRVVLGLGVVDRGTAASVGAVTWVAGTSSASGVAPATNWVNTALTRVSAVDIITTTSTMLGSSGTYGLWRTGEYLNWVSGTTTNAGSCRVIYY